MRITGGRLALVEEEQILDDGAALWEMSEKSLRSTAPLRTTQAAREADAERGNKVKLKKHVR